MIVSFRRLIELCFLFGHTLDNIAQLILETLGYNNIYSNTFFIFESKKK